MNEAQVTITARGPLDPKTSPATFNRKKVSAKQKKILRLDKHVSTSMLFTTDTLK